MTQNERSEILKKTMEQINTDHGEGSIMSLEDKPSTREDIVSSGSMGLDLALGVGGYAKGRIVEIYGPESSGKTTLAIHAIAECQKAGGSAAIIDAEHSFDKDYARALGVDTETLLISQPDFGEQGLEIADKLICSGAVDIVVIDSVAALVPKGELEGEMGESKMGLHARLMSQAMRKLVANVARNNVLLIFINQLREKIGIMFGNPETTTGGNALKFYASIRLDVRKSLNKVDKGEDPLSNKVTVKVIKNKVAPPHRKAEFDILFGEGIDRIGEVLDMATELGIVVKSGSWYSYEGSRLGQGKDGVKGLLKDNDLLFNEIEQLVKTKIQE